jgi:phosphatidylglycerophosphatase A
VPAEARPAGRTRRLLLSALGLGLSPVAPGTVASLATAAAVALAERAAGAGLGVAGLLAALGALATVAWGAGVERDGKDPSWVVTDEVAGQALASAAAAWVGGWSAAACAFVLFRVLDVAKPGPVRRLEGVRGGLGILLDDVAAGLGAGAVVLAAGLLGAFRSLP